MGLSDGTTAHTLVLDFLGPRQVGGIAWAKFLQVERPVDRDQGLGLASSNERTGSSNGLREMRATQGWAGHPVRLMTQGLTSVEIRASRNSDAPHRKTSDGLRRVGRFVLHAITVSSDDKRLPVMHQPVDQGRGQGVVHIQEGSPFPEGSIRGEHDRAGFVPGGDYLEQQIGPALIDRQIAQLIEKGQGT